MKDEKIQMVYYAPPECYAKNEDEPIRFESLKKIEFIEHHALDSNNDAATGALSFKLGIEIKEIKSKIRTAFVAQVNDVITKYNSLCATLTKYNSLCATLTKLDTSKNLDAMTKKTIKAVSDFADTIQNFTLQDICKEAKIKRDDGLDLRAVALSAATGYLDADSDLHKIFSFAAKLSNPNNRADIAKNKTYPITAYDFVSQKGQISIYDLVVDQLLAKANINYAALDITAKHYEKLQQAEIDTNVFLDGMRNKDDNLALGAIPSVLNLLKINEPLGFSVGYIASSAEFAAILDCIDAIRFDKELANDMAYVCKVKTKFASDDERILTNLKKLIFQASGYSMNDNFEKGILLKLYSQKDRDALKVINKPEEAEESVIAPVIEPEPEPEPKPEPKVIVPVAPAPVVVVVEEKPIVPSKETPTEGEKKSEKEEPDTPTEKEQKPEAHKPRFPIKHKETPAPVSNGGVTLGDFASADVLSKITNRTLKGRKLDPIDDEITDSDIDTDSSVDSDQSWVDGEPIQDIGEKVMHYRTDVDPTDLGYIFGKQQEDRKLEEEQAVENGKKSRKHKQKLPPAPRSERGVIPKSDMQIATDKATLERSIGMYINLNGVMYTSGLAAEYPDYAVDIALEEAGRVNDELKAKAYRLAAKYYIPATEYSIEHEDMENAKKYYNYALDNLEYFKEAEKIEKLNALAVALGLEPELTIPTEPAPVVEPVQTEVTPVDSTTSTDEVVADEPTSPIEAANKQEKIVEVAENHDDSTETEEVNNPEAEKVNDEKNDSDELVDNEQPKNEEEQKTADTSDIVPESTDGGDKKPKKRAAKKAKKEDAKKTIVELSPEEEDKIYQAVIERINKYNNFPKGEQRISRQYCDLLKALIDVKTRRSIPVEHTEVFMDKIQEMSNKIQHLKHSNDIYQATECVNQYLYNAVQLPQKLIEMSSVFEDYMYKCLRARERRNSVSNIIYDLDKIDSTKEKEAYQDVTYGIIGRKNSVPTTKARITIEYVQLLDNLLKIVETHSNVENPNFVVLKYSVLQHKDAFLEYINQKAHSHAGRQSVIGPTITEALKYSLNYEKEEYLDRELPEELIKMLQVADEYASECLHIESSDIQDERSLFKAVYADFERQTSNEIILRIADCRFMDKIIEIAQDRDDIELPNKDIYEKMIAYKFNSTQLKRINKNFELAIETLAQYEDPSVEMPGYVKQTIRQCCKFFDKYYKYVTDKNLIDYSNNSPAEAQHADSEDLVESTPVEQKQEPAPAPEHEDNIPNDATTENEEFSITKAILATVSERMGDLNQNAIKYMEVFGLAASVLNGVSFEKSKIELGKLNLTTDEPVHMGIDQLKDADTENVDKSSAFVKSITDNLDALEDMKLTDIKIGKAVYQDGEWSCDDVVVTTQKGIERKLS